VTEGPFASFLAEVTAIDAERARITVDVEIFGRMTPVELDIAQIEKV
jgi:transcriptional antiterminator NusG